MTRRCSHCGQDGHNSRTCPDRGPDREVRLFGVRLTGNDGFTSANMRKSASMGNLTHYPNAGNTPSTPEHSECGAAEDGYVSDGLVQTSSNARERKKGVPWTEEEHRLFLVGLQKLGKGDWRGIARNFVQSRTPTQVASHAQKYFIRQSNLNKRKRRSSLFDIVSETGPRPMAEDVSVAKIPDVSSPPHQLSLGPSLGPGAYLSHGRVFEPGMALVSRGSEVFAPMLPVAGVAPGDYQNLSHLQGAIPLQVLPLGSGGASASKEVGGEATGSYGGDVAILSRQVPMSEAENTSGSGRAALPPLGPPVVQPLGQPMGHLGYPYSVWMGPRYPPPPSLPLPSKVVKPTACPAKIDEGCEMAKLSLGPSQPAEGSNLTRIMLEQHPTRTSAFQLKPAFSNKSLSPSSISVV